MRHYSDEHEIKRQFGSILFVAFGFEASQVAKPALNSKLALTSSRHGMIYKYCSCLTVFSNQHIATTLFNHPRRSDHHYHAFLSVSSSDSRFGGFSNYNHQ